MVFNGNIYKVNVSAISQSCMLMIKCWKTLFENKIFCQVACFRFDCDQWRIRKHADF